MISVLGQRLDLTGTEIAEAIWLAGQLSVEGDRHRGEVDSERVEESESDRNGGEDNPQEERVDDNLQEDSGNDSREGPGSTTEIVPQPGESEEFPPFPEGHYKPIPIPDPAAIPETLQYARALRPLAHKIAVGKPEIVDERATVAQIADTGVWQPVLRAKLELWLDVVVVYDRSPSMCLWGRFAKDLRQLLSRYGQFRDLREWFFDYDASGGVTLRSRNGTVHHPRELLTGDRRRLILIISDCVAPAWHGGQIRDVVAVWADHCLTVLLQVFPERLWSRTALARATMVLFEAKQPGLASNELTPRPRLYWDRDRIHAKHRPPSQIYLPIITLDPEILSDLAGVAVGDQRARIAGIAWDESDCQPLQQVPNSSPQRDPLEFFRLTASPTAQRLASLLAAAPVINLPIVRLIQRSMLPQSNPAHVAEVLMSRVFTRVSSVAPTLENADSLLYQVRSEPVRQQLLDQTGLLETVDVIEQVSAYVAQRLGKSMEQFKALLRYPQQARPEEGEFLQAFARVTGTVLRSLGDEFAVYAEELTGDNDLVASNLNSDGNFQKSTDPNSLLESNIESNDDISGDLEDTARDDEELNQLALYAQQSPAGSTARRIALERLIERLVSSGCLDTHNNEFYPNTYQIHQDIHDEAVQNLFVYICINIDNYNPEYSSFKRWVKFLLRRRFIPNASKDKNKLSINDLTVDDLTGLSGTDDYSISENKNKSLLEIVRQCIEEDENQVFRSKYLNRRHSFNFQDIILRRLDGYTWKEISAEFTVPISALASFYSRNLSELAPLIKEYIHD